MSQETLNEIVGVFFTIQMTTKLYHWNTTSYARHKASDDFGGNLSSIMDKFVEVYIGRYNVKPVVKKIKLDCQLMTEDGIVDLLVGLREYLKTFETKVCSTDLLNIRDELLACVNQTLYK